MHGVLAGLIGLMAFAIMTRTAGASIPKENEVESGGLNFTFPTDIFDNLFTPASFSLGSNELARQKAETLIKSREGYSAVVYKDADGISAGWGHFITEGGYNIGDTITEQQAQKWFNQDFNKAFSAALNQARQLGVTNPDFIAVLASVNYQSGEYWYTVHPKTWNALKRGDAATAIAELRSSLWYQQTPTRVNDFITAINNTITRSA